MNEVHGPNKAVSVTGAWARDRQNGAVTSDVRMRSPKTWAMEVHDSTNKASARLWKREQAATKKTSGSWNSP